MNLKIMTKRRGAKFKAPPWPLRANCHEIFLEDKQNYHLQPSVRDSDLNLVDSFNVALDLSPLTGASWWPGRLRFKILVIFVVKCFILSILINTPPTCYGLRNDKPTMQAAPSTSSTTTLDSQTLKSKVLITSTEFVMNPTNGHHHHTPDMKLLKPQAESPQVANQSEGSIISRKPVEREARDGGDALETPEASARASKQLKKLLARPRHILTSFVPHALTKQLVIKRPNNLMTIKLKRLHEKLKHANQNQGKNDDKSTTSDRNKLLQQQQQLFNPQTSDLEMRPMGPLSVTRPTGTRIGEPPPPPSHFPFQPPPPLPQRPTLGALEVLPLILTPAPAPSAAVAAGTSHNDDGQPVGSSRLSQRPFATGAPGQQQQSQPAGVVNIDQDDGDRLANTERELDHIDQLIRSEYEKRVNINEDFIGGDGRNSSSIGSYESQEPNPALEDSPSIAQADGGGDDDDLLAGRHWPASDGDRRQFEATSHIRARGEQPAGRVLMDSSQEEREQLEDAQKRFKGPLMNANLSHPSFRYRGSTFGGGGGGESAQEMDSYDDSDARKHHYFNRNRRPTIGRLATGNSNPKPIIQLLTQQDQQQQAFMPTALETIAQLRLNMHNSNITNQAINGTKSQPYSHSHHYHHPNAHNHHHHQRQQAQDAIYLKVPSSHPLLIPKSSKPSSSPRQQNLQPHHQLDGYPTHFHHNYPAPAASQGQQQVARDTPSYSGDGGRAYLAPPTSGLNSHHHQHEKFKRFNGHQIQTIPDSIEQIISSMTAPTSTSNNHGEMDGNLSSQYYQPLNKRKDSAPTHNHQPAGGAASSEGSSKTNADDNDGHSIELSETLRKLRETKARIRQLQAELNVSDPNLLLLSPFETNHSASTIVTNRKDDIWDEVGKNDDSGGHDLGNGGGGGGGRDGTTGSKHQDVAKVTDGLLAQTHLTASSDSNSNHYQRKDWFRLWPRNISSSSDTTNINSKQLADRSSMVAGSHELSMNPPLGMYHNGPLGASARLVASAFGRAAKNTGPPPPPPMAGSHQVPMFSRPHVARVHGSAPVLVGSTMLVGGGGGGTASSNGDPIDDNLHTITTTTAGQSSMSLPAGTVAIESTIDTTSSSMASPELGNGDRLLNNVNTFKEATIGQRLGAQFRRPIGQLGGAGETAQKSDGGQIQVSAAAFDHTTTGPFTTMPQSVTATVQATQTVVSHNGFQPMNQTDQRLMDMTMMTATKGLASSPLATTATSESFNINNSTNKSGNNSNNHHHHHQNSNHNNDQLSTSTMDANRRETLQVTTTTAQAARYPNHHHHQLSIKASGGGNNATAVDLQQRPGQLRDPSPQLTGSGGGGGQQLATFERKQQGPQANGSQATIGSSISSRIAAATSTSGSRSFSEIATAHGSQQQVEDSNGSSSSNLSQLFSNGKQHHGQFSDSFDQESVNSINRLLPNGPPASAPSYAPDSSSFNNRHQQQTGGRIITDTTAKALNVSNSSNSIGQLFSKLFQNLTFSSPSSVPQANGNHVAQVNNNNRQLQQNSTWPTNNVAVGGSGSGGSGSGNSVTMVESKLTTEKVLHTLIAFSCSLALLCLFVVVATVRCQMRVRKRARGSRAALSIGSSGDDQGQAGSSSSSSAGALVGPTSSRGLGWCRRFGIGGLGGDTARRLGNKKGDLLILDGTMRNVSMLARHQNTDSNKISQELRKPLNLPLPLFKRTCCHCVSCSESWLFRESSSAPSSSSSSSASKSNSNNDDTKKKTTGTRNLCSSGFYHPAPRGRLPFGAASSVNKLLNQKQLNSTSGGGTDTQAAGQNHKVIKSDQVAPAEMLKSPSVRGPIGGTRLRMMSAIEERTSPEPLGPEAECVCGQCYRIPDKECAVCKSVDSETMERHHCNHLVPKAAAVATDNNNNNNNNNNSSGANTCEGCNCHVGGGGGCGNNVASLRPLPVAANPPNCSFVNCDMSAADGEPVSVDQQVEMSLNDDGLIVGSRSMEAADSRELELINELANVKQQKQQQQHRQTTTSAKNTTTLNTITSAANCENCLSDGGGGGGGGNSSGPHCCKLRAKHANLNLGNGSCFVELEASDDNGGDQAAERARAANTDNNNNNATIDRARTSAKSVLSPANAKLQHTNTTNNHLRECSPATFNDGGVEMVSSNLGGFIEGATGCLDNNLRHKQKQQQQQQHLQRSTRDQHQLVRARVSQFDGARSQLVPPDSRRNQQVAGQDELADAHAETTCCPHDSDTKCELLDGNHRLREERSRRRATAARIAAFASSPLSLAATIQGKLRKTMANGASAAAAAAANLNAQHDDASNHGQQNASSILGGAECKPAAQQQQLAVKGARQRPNRSQEQQLRIEVEPANKFNKLQEGLAVRQDRRVKLKN